MFQTQEMVTMVSTDTTSEAVDLGLRFKLDFCKPEVRTDPYPYYRALLATPPIMVQREIPWAIVSRYDDVVKVLHDHDGYSSVRSDLPGTEIHDPFKGVPTMVYADKPQHSRLHSVLAPSLTKAQIDAAVPLIGKIVDRVLDQKAQGRRQVNGVADIAHELPMKVLGGMRGMSDAESDEMHKLMFESLSRDTTPNPRAIADKVVACVSRMVDVRGGASEGQDPISICVAARQRGDLDDPEFVGMVTLSVMAGILTIAEALSGSLYQMLSRPAVHEQVSGNPSLIPQLIEESMRYDPPVHLALRTTTREVEVGGLRIASRTPVLVYFAAANRDPRKFPNPDNFDITRTNVRDHLAFGQGIHYCIGHWLGRVVLRVAIERLVERFPRMRLAKGFTPTYVGNYNMRGVESLPILID